MAGVRLDPRGSLLEFYRVPPEYDPDEEPPGEPSWDILFAAAGLDRGAFKTATPQWLPPFGCDHRFAWKGTFPGRADLPLRIEAASWRGQPVFFRLVGPEWARPERTSPTLAGSIPSACLLLGLFALTGWLAWRNVRAGRIDRQGATRAVLVFLACRALAWLLAFQHTWDLGTEGESFVYQLGVAILGGTFIVLGYVALEPAIRRRWPWRLTSWLRLLAGRWRDPMVGRDLLIGLAAGGASLMLGHFVVLAVKIYGFPVEPVDYVSNQEFGSPASPGRLLYQVSTALIAPWLFLVATFLFYRLFRREWLAWISWFVLLFAVCLTANATAGTDTIAAPSIVVSTTLLATQFFVLARFGILACILCNATQLVVDFARPTVDPSVWYFGQGLTVALIFAALAVFAFRTATAGQPLWRRGLFDEE
jgi:serine/threonine-protein kinase